jgi:hypothetical protein
LGTIIKTIKLQDCPFDWVLMDNEWEWILTVGEWHEHFSREEYVAFEKLLDENSLELQEKYRGNKVVATRMCRILNGGEILLFETGLLFSPFWRKLSYKHHPLRKLPQASQL